MDDDRKAVAQYCRAWRGERSQELVAGLLGTSARTIQRLEDNGEVTLPLIRAIEFCYSLEVVSAVYIASARGTVVWRNAFAAAVGVGDVGHEFLHGHLATNELAQRTEPPVGLVLDRIFARTTPTRTVRVLYYWRRDGVPPIYRARFLDNGTVFMAENERYLYGAFRASRVDVVGA